MSGLFGNYPAHTADIITEMRREKKQETKGQSQTNGYTAEKK